MNHPNDLFNKESDLKCKKQHGNSISFLLVLTLERFKKRETSFFNWPLTQHRYILVSFLRNDNNKNVSEREK